MSVKGSWKRPCTVPQEKLEENWNRIFKKKKQVLKKEAPAPK